MKQTGQVMVHCFPKMPILEDMLDIFAAEKGFAARDSLMACAVENPMEAEWSAFLQYAKAVDPDKTARYGYVSLCDHIEGDPSSEESRRQRTRSVTVPRVLQQRTQQSTGGQADRTLQLY